jgi:hypothetical protein
MSSTPLFTKEDCTVFSFDGKTGMLTELGSGTVTKTINKIESKALLDASQRIKYGNYAYTVDAELRATTELGNLFPETGVIAALTITTDVYTLSGNFGCDEVSNVLGEAMRWNVKLSSDGDVTCS